MLARFSTWTLRLGSVGMAMALARLPPPSHAQTAALPTRLAPAQPPVGPDPRLYEDSPSEAVIHLPPIIEDDFYGEGVVVQPGAHGRFDPYYGDVIESGYHGWTTVFLPEGLLYHSYLAGVKEPRMAAHFIHEKDQGWLFEPTLGGRVGLVRYGTANRAWPEGWQLDLEGAVFPRLDLETKWDLLSADFRFGIPLTYRAEKWQAKFGYYHLSSHLGDEMIARDPPILAERINFSRDVIILGVGYFLNPSFRLYAEAGWGFFADEGTEPWEFQFGAEYSPVYARDTSGAPFLAVNGHLREEVAFGGSLTVQTGWQWRGESGRRLRTGLHYYNGNSSQFEFFSTAEEQIGLGIWYDY